MSISIRSVFSARFNTASSFVGTSPIGFALLEGRLSAYTPRAYRLFAALNVPGFTARYGLADKAKLYVWLPGELLSVETSFKMSAFVVVL